MTKPSTTPGWTVPLDHPSLAGHFPDRPILPGVLLLDRALYDLSTATGMALQKCTISSVKFFSPANPGDKIAIEYAIAADGTLRFEITGTGAGSLDVRKIASGVVVAGQPS